MKKIVIALVSLFAFAPLAFAAVPSASMQETIGVGKTLSVGFNSTPTISSNSNPAVASAIAGTNSITVRGYAVGSTVVNACDATSCLNLTVNVSGVLGAYTSAHPVGSWVNLGKTVYYVHANGLIPIATWEIFVSNGGTASMIIPINDGDQHLPLLALMTMNDSRVK